MQASNKRRVVLYAGAALTLSGLVYGGFVYRSTPDVETLISCARPQIALGMHEHAEPFVRDALAQEPDHFEGSIMLAAIHENAGRKVEALELYQRLLPRSEESGMRSEIQVAIARLHYEAGRIQQALDLVLAIQPEAEDTQWKAGLLHIRCLHASGQTEGLEARVHALEELSNGTWSGAKLRVELGLPPVDEPESAEQKANSSDAIQGANGSSR